MLLVGDIGRCLDKEMEAVPDLGGASPQSGRIWKAGLL
jgi:hypothetical protein